MDIWDIVDGKAALEGVVGMAEKLSWGSLQTAQRL